jgi:uncharacterized protein (TIGR02147 family)
MMQGDNIQTELNHQEAHGLQIDSTSKKPAAKAAPEERVSAFGYMNYRLFLEDYFEARREKNPTFSMSAFVRKAGLGQNSRGYVKLIIDGKRDLTPYTINGFIQALGLTGKEAQYFENLVYFNQASKPRAKEHYFQRLTAAMPEKLAHQSDLLKSQHSYYSKWYVVAVRELVGLAQFVEDPAWIVGKLRNKISKKEALEALKSLETLGLIRRDDAGRLSQSQPLVKFKGGYFDYVIERFQLEMIERAKEALLEDEYQDRNASSVTLSCDTQRVPEIKKMIDGFRDQLNTAFGLGNQCPDAVVQVNFQVFQITPTKKRRTHESSV